MRNENPENDKLYINEDIFLVLHRAINIKLDGEFFFMYNKNIEKFSRYLTVYLFKSYYCH